MNNTSILDTVLGNIDIKRAWKRLLSIPQSEALAIAYHS